MLFSRPFRSYWATVLGVAIFVAGAGCSGSHEPLHASAAGPVPTQVAPTTNVPALLGASIDSLRQRLGAPHILPANFRTAVAGALRNAATNKLDSLATFQTGGLLLVASYDTHSRQVRDLLLLGHHEDSLMGRAQLQANAADYLVLPVFYSASSSRLLGLRVIATQ